MFCEKRYTTYERIQTSSVQVVKRDQRREDFNADKLRTSILKACAKRPVPVGAIDKLVADIEGDVYAQGLAEVDSALIGEAVIARLKDFDRVAYIRFASVYRDFDDLETFRQEIDALQSGEESDEKVNQLTYLGSDPGVVRAPAASPRSKRPKKAAEG